VRGLGRLAPAGLAARFRGSLRFKLLALALGPLLFAVPILVGILVAWGAVYYDRLLITKVQSDLAVAHGYFDQVKQGVGAPGRNPGRVRAPGSHAARAPGAIGTGRTPARDAPAAEAGFPDPA
jgi:two-component system NtrC family sensor kinase